MKYYLNISDEPHNPSHRHKIHRDGCYWLPSEKNRTYIGDYTTAETALQSAKTLHRKYCPIDGCEYCCLDLYDNIEQLTLFS